LRFRSLSARSSSSSKKKKEEKTKKKEEKKKKKVKIVAHTLNKQKNNNVTIQVNEERPRVV